MNFGVNVPDDRLKSVSEFSPLLATETKLPVGSTAIPNGMLDELWPELNVVVAVKAPVPPIENPATVPSNELVTKRNLPAGSVTASNGKLRFVAIADVPIKVNAPVPELIENADKVLLPLLGT